MSIDEVLQVRARAKVDQAIDLLVQALQSSAAHFETRNAWLTSIRVAVRDVERRSSEGEAWVESRRAIGDDGPTSTNCES